MLPLNGMSEQKFLLETSVVQKALDKSEIKRLDYDHLNLGCLSIGAGTIAALCVDHSKKRNVWDKLRSLGSIGSASVLGMIGLSNIVQSFKIRASSGDSNVGCELAMPNNLSTVARSGSDIDRLNLSDCSTLKESWTSRLAAVPTRER